MAIDALSYLSFEADMERFAAFEKDDFVGKMATQRVKQAGIVARLVYMEVEPGDCDVHGGEPLIADGKVVGVTTSGAYGHRTGRNLGFVYVEPRLAEPGTEFSVDILGEPACDPGNFRRESHGSRPCWAVFIAHWEICSAH